MLNLKFKTNKTINEYQELVVGEMYFDENGEYLTGITDYNNSLIDGQTIYIDAYNDGNIKPCTIKVENVVRQGYVRNPNRKLLVEYITIDNETIAVVRGDDGKIYGVDIEGGVCTIDGVSYNVSYIEPSSFTDGFYVVTVPQTIPIEDGRVLIDGMYYDIMVDNPNMEQTITVYSEFFANSTDYKVSVQNSNDWRTVTKITILKGEDYELLLDDFTCMKKYYYINHSNTAILPNNVINDENVNNGKFYGIEPYKIYFNLHENDTDWQIGTMDIKLDGNTYTVNVNEKKLEVQHEDWVESYPIEYEWLNSDKSNGYVNLYVANDKHHFKVGDKIICKSLDSTYSSMDVMSDYFVYSPNMQKKYGKEIIKNGKVYYNFNFSYYKNEFIDVDENVEFKNGGLENLSFSIGDDNFNIKKEEYIIFNGKRCIVSDDEISYLVVTYKNDIFRNSERKVYYEITKHDYNGDEKFYVGTYNLHNKPHTIYVSGGTIFDDYFTVNKSDDIILEIKSFKYVTINKQRYHVIEKEEYSTIDEVDNAKVYSSKIVEISSNEEYELQVDGVRGSNSLRCTIYCDNKIEVLNNLYKNRDSFKFYLVNELFPSYIVNDVSYGYVKNDEGYAYGDEPIKFYSRNSFIALPLQLSNTIATNLLQDKVIQEDFVNVEHAKSINRIVDMEKDIYYPAFDIDDGVKLLSELSFNLHFRTRNLNDWKVNEDIAVSYLEEGGNASGLTNAMLASNWNIIDYYYDDLKDIGAEIGIMSGQNVTYEWVNYDGNDDLEEEYGVNEKMRVRKQIHGAIQKNLSNGQVEYSNGGKGAWDADRDDDHNPIHSTDPSNYCEDNEYYSKKITKYEQPSDLLYFLNFTDDDVYEQKEKIKKSFLRLLFYDSDDPRTQNLLATSTIFFDVDKLYKHYLENTDPNTHDDYGFINMSNGKYSEYVGVNKEPFYLGGDGIWTYDEEFRIDATFKVKNMYEEEKSCEGFYLYLFKEYSSNLHERNIYLKIQFNHAGTGKVVNFLVPTDSGHTNDDGYVEYDMLDITDKEQREWFKKGYPLDEIYERLYTKIKVKYDEKLKKYVYCLPNFMRNPNNPNKVVFNLYELKIKDESAIKYEQDTENG